VRPIEGGQDKQPERHGRVDAKPECMVGSLMTTVSVKQQYVEVYGGEHFAGELKSHPMLQHGAWICELYVPEARGAVTFRLGHLDSLVGDGVDLLRKARAAGWNGHVASVVEDVTIWTARERVWEMIHIAGQPPVEQSGMVLSNEPGQGEWKALEVNLGRPPDPSERDLFVKEFKRVLSDPNSTNEWPEG
jgi:hypothetical protein